MSENTEGELFSLSLFSGIEKFRIGELGGGGGVPIFSVQIVLSQSEENFRRVTLLCCLSETF